MDSVKRIELVEKSFEIIKANRDDFAIYFYNELFKQYPYVKTLFSKTNTSKQSAKLFAALAVLVENLRQPEEIKELLVPLDTRHIAYDALPDYYTAVSETLIACLKGTLHNDWNKDVELAWSKTLQDVAEIMLQSSELHSNKTEKKSAIENSQETVPDYLLLKNSFEYIKNNKEIFNDSFYRTLFELSPEIKPLFANVDISSQSKKLFKALVLLVENIQKPEVIESILTPLGQRHRGYGVIDIHYPMVSKALIMTLRECAQEVWSDETERAWTRTYQSVQDIMLGEPPKAPSKLESQLLKEASNSTNVGQKKIRKKRSKKDLSSWFYTAPLSHIILIWAVVGCSVVSLSWGHPDLRSVVLFANPLSLLLGLFLFIKEAPERKKQFHYHAWSIIDSANGVKTSHARFLALQDLCEDRVSFKNLELEDVYLKGISLPEPDFESANLFKCDLSDSDLEKSDFNNANLSHALLVGAKINNSNLSFANLANANLNYANLSNTNLLFANLKGATLSGISLEGANLKGAILEGAFLAGANLTNADVGSDQLDNCCLEGAVMPDGELYKPY